MHKKKIIALGLSLCLFLSASSPAFALDTKNSQQTQTLKQALQRAEQLKKAAEAAKKEAAKREAAIKALQKQIESLLKEKNKSTQSSNATIIEALTSSVKLAMYKEVSFKSPNTSTIDKSLKDIQVIQLLLLGMEKKIVYADELNAVNLKAAIKKSNLAKYMVRAMGLEEEAKKLMNEKLTFKDAASVSKLDIGYIALAHRLGLITANKNKEIQPNKSISKSDINDMFNKAVKLLKNSNPAPTPAPSFGEKLNTQNVQFNALSEALKIEVEAVKAVETYRAYNGDGSLFLVSSGGNLFNAKITGVFRTAFENNKQLLNVVVEKAPIAQTNPVTPVTVQNVQVQRVTSSVNMANIEAINFIDKNGTLIAQTSPAALAKIERISGTVNSIDAATSTIVMTRSNNALQSYVIPTGAVVAINDVASNLLNIRPNMSVTIVRINDVITRVDVKDIVSEQTGLFVGHINSTSKLMVLKMGSQFRTFVVSDSVAILLNGQRAALEQIPVNTELVIRFVNETLVEIRNK